MTPTGKAESPLGHGGSEMSGERALTREEVMIWLEASCASQGVPLHVVDRATLGQVRVLLGMGIDVLEGADAAGTTSARAERASRTARRERDDRAS